MKAWLLIVGRELHLALFKQGYFYNILSLFFLISFTLYISSVFNNKIDMPVLLLLSYTITAIFSSSYIFYDDFHDSSLVQLLISGISTMTLITAKIVSYWIMLTVTVAINILYCIISYDISAKHIYLIFLFFIPLSLMVTSITAFVSALTINLKKADLISFLIAVPLLSMLLLYGSSVLNNFALFNDSQKNFMTDLQIIFALSLIITPISIYACSYIISKI